MRSLYYLAFGVAFFGAQACSNDVPAPPPFKAESAQQSGDATDEPADPGANDPASSEGLSPEPGAPLDPAACSVTFTKDILPKVRDQWRCGASACHGNPTVNKPVMDTTNADATYALLTTFVHQGKKVVNTSSMNADDSSLYCLMQGTCGARMPQQGVDALDLAMVKAWLECNAPR